MVRVSDAVVAEISKLKRDGLSTREISTKTGVAKSTVFGIIKRQPVEEAVADGEIPELSVEETMIIPDSAASDFLTSISAVEPAAPPPPPSVSSVAETKSLSQRIQVAESFLGSNFLKSSPPPKTRASRQHVRMPSVVEDALDDLQKAPPAGVKSASTVGKADLIAQITMNVEAFEPLLGSIIHPNRQSFLAGLYGKSEGDLETVLGVITRTRTLANVSNQLRHTVIMVAQGTEAFTSRMMKMKTEGFSQAILSQDEEIRMILREMVMDKMDSFDKYQRPELRLAMLFTTTLLATDSANRMKEATKERSGKTLNPAVAEKHRDL